MRTAPHDVTIRQMTPGDIDAGLALCRASGWNQTARDWESFLNAAPAGSLVAEADGRVVGTVATMPYGAFTWISMVLVEPASRGRGIGSLLLERGLVLLPADVAARLDATELGEPLYRTLGFLGEYGLARWFLDDPRLAGRGAAGARPFKPEDWGPIDALDRRAFGASRLALLERFVDEAPEYAWVLEGVGGLRGYLFGRRGHNRDQLGPLVADSSSSAIALIDMCLADHPDRRFFIDVPEDRRAWTEGLAGRGFRIERSFLRMHRGVLRASGDPTLVYAITGPEFG